MSDIISQNTQSILCWFLGDYLKKCQVAIQKIVVETDGDWASSHLENLK